MNTATRKTGLTLAVLCAASFAMVTTEFAPIGLLSPISQSLGQSPESVAYTVAVYAWVGAASGLLAGNVLRLIPRRWLLVLLMLTMAASNALTSFATDLPALMFARIVGGVAHGLFWATAAATAQMLVPPKRVGFATSLVMLGITLATVLGVPLTNMMGSLSNWRVAFLLLSSACLLCAMLLASLLPDLTEQPNREDSVLSVLRNRKDLVLTYVITGLTAAAHFGAYTFIEPLVSGVPNLTPYDCATLLFLFGVAGFVGNIASALLIDRYLLTFIACAPALMAASLWTLGGPVVSGFYGVAVLLMTWGACIAGLFTALQTWVLNIGGGQSVPATAIHTTVLNSAIGVGTVAGGQIFAAFGLNSAIVCAASLLVPAIFLVLRTLVSQRRKRLGSRTELG